MRTKTLAIVVILTALVVGALGYFLFINHFPYLYSIIRSDSGTRNCFGSVICPYNGINYVEI